MTVVGAAPHNARPTLEELRALGLARGRYRVYDPMQRLALGLNRITPLLALNRGLYRAALAVALRYVTVQGVESVYLRGSMASGLFVPGMSDIDLQFVIAELSPSEEYELQRRFWTRFRRLRRLLPIFGDAFSGTVREYQLGARDGHLFVASGAKQQVLHGPGCDFEALGIEESTLAAAALKRCLRNYFKSVSMSWAGMVEGVHRGFYRLRRGFMNDAERLLGERPAPLERLWGEERRLASQGYRTRDAEATAQRIFLTSFEVMRLLANSPLKGLPYGPDTAPSPAVWPEAAPPAHLDRARRWAEGLHRQLRRIAPGAAVRLLLGASAARDHDYRLYAVVPDNMEQAELLEAASAVRSAYWRCLADGPWDLFTTFRAPLIMPAAAMALLPMGYRGPGEHAYLRRHGVCFDADVSDLALRCRNDWERLSLRSETILNCTYLRKRFWEIPKDRRKVRGVLHDLLAGAAPAARLALENNLVATTVAEAQAAFRRTYGHSEVEQLSTVAKACLAGGNTSLETNGCLGCCASRSTRSTPRWIGIPSAQTRRVHPPKSFRNSVCSLTRIAPSAEGLHYTVCREGEAMRGSRDRHARTRAQEPQSDDRTETNRCAPAFADRLSETLEAAAGVSCGAVLGGVYGGASFGWKAALAGAVFGAIVATIAVAAFWSLRTFLKRGVVRESPSSIQWEGPYFSGINRSAIVAEKSRPEVNLAVVLACWTIAGAIVGAAVGAGFAALLDTPYVARGAIRIAPACAALAFLARLAARPLRQTAG